MSLIFVDVEADFNSPCPGIGLGMTEFGAVEFDTRLWFHGKPNPVDLNDWPVLDTWYHTMVEFDEWIRSFRSTPIFVSDNPAYDWQWINYHFHHCLHRNPFGFSARRIGDFYAGLKRDFRNSNKWKRHRKTPHTHNPVDDAMGNVEAFEHLLSLCIDGLAKRKLEEDE